MPFIVSTHFTASLAVLQHVSGMGAAVPLPAPLEAPTVSIITLEEHCVTKTPINQRIKVVPTSCSLCVGQGTVVYQESSQYCKLNAPFLILDFFLFLFVRLRICSWVWRLSGSSKASLSRDHYGFRGSHPLSRVW